MISRKELQIGQLYLFWKDGKYIAAEFTGDYNEYGEAIMKYKNEIFYIKVGD